MPQRLASTSFEEIFRAENSCSHEQFKRAMFWRTMPFHACLGVILLGGTDSTHFEAERRLLDGLAEAEDMQDVRAFISDYLGDTADRGWLRAVAGTEISVRRLKLVARAYLPGRGSHSANPFHVFQKIEQ